MRWRSKLLVAALPPLVLLTCGLVACGARTGLDLPLVDAGEDASHVQPLNCAREGITYIYVIGQDNNLYSYYPATAEFTVIGALDCPSLTSPFSMAVDRQGVAYVLFQDGNLFRVSTKTSVCEATAFIPNQQGFGTFGMGFVANTDGDAGETLYIARDHLQSTEPSAALGTIDLATFEVSEIAPFTGAAVTGAELTGTGGGKLYGFYAPTSMAPPSFIIQIDPATAGVLGSTTLPSVQQGEGWAFGFWGGDFYTFTAPDSVTTVVTRFRPSDGSIVQVATAPLGVIIVGAGVSTCAPQQ